MDKTEKTKSYESCQIRWVAEVGRIQDYERAENRGVSTFATIEEAVDDLLNREVRKTEKEVESIKQEFLQRKEKGSARISKLLSSIEVQTEGGL